MSLRLSYRAGLPVSCSCSRNQNKLLSKNPSFLIGVPAAFTGGFFVYSCRYTYNGPVRVKMQCLATAPGFSKPHAATAEMAVIFDRI